MEMLLLAMVLGWVVKNGVKDLVHTGATAICAVQGKPAPAWGSRRRMKRPEGAATRYFRELWNDSWDSALARHKERNARRDVAGPADAGRVSSSLFRGNFRDALRFTHRRWHATWIRLKILRNLKNRPRPAQDTVPGEVVPNREEAHRETRDRPQDETGPDPGTEQDEDGTTDQDEPIVQPDPSQRDCRNCTDRHWHDQYCLYVGDDPWIGTADNQDDNQTTAPLASTTNTQEGPITMTATTAEVVGLDSAIRFCEDSARAYRAQMEAIEQTQAALAAGDVTGPAAENFSQAMEQSNLAAASMDAAAAELLRHKQVQEAYLANQGAGTRDFILAGQ